MYFNVYLYIINYGSIKKFKLIIMGILKDLNFWY